MSKDNDNDILSALADINEAIGTRFDRVDQQVTELRADIDQQFSNVHNQLDRIEHTILEQHAGRLEVIERKLGIGS